MNRMSGWIACFVTALSLLLPVSQASARTDVSINLRIGDPYRGPRVVFEDEPDIVVVPNTRVYYIRDYDYDIYRYGTFWYYNYGGAWYRARRYDGPFVYVGYRSVPHSVVYLPGRYRRHWGDHPQGNAYGHYKARGGWHDNGRGHEDRGWDDRGGRGHDKGRGHGSWDDRDDRGHDKGHGHGNH